MCKSISIKSAVPKSAVDGTKSAVEGRKKSHTRFFLFLFSFSLLFLNVSNLERYKVHQNNVAGKNLKQYYNVKQQKEKKSSLPESHFCHAWDVANAKLSNLERSDKS